MILTCKVVQAFSDLLQLMIIEEKLGWIELESVRTLQVVVIKADAETN